MTERFSASVAGRLMSCPASGNLELAIPNWVAPVEDPTVNNAANRGSNMHEVFAGVMSLPNADMQRLIQAMQYVADVRATRRFKALVEQTVTATWLRTQPKTTLDLGLYVQDEIHVFDLKTGRIAVEVIDNPQLLYYAASVAHLAPKADGVNLHVLQPWANGNEHWFASTKVLAEFIKEARAAEQKLLDKDLTFGPSDDGCKFCPANPHTRGLKGKPLCPTMMHMLYPPIIHEDEILGL